MKTTPDTVFVTLPQMLAAREQRQIRQQAMLAAYRMPLVCYTMNIAGPFKDSPLIRRGFRLGLLFLRRQLAAAGCSVAAMQCYDAPTGPEAYLAADTSAKALKALTAELEDSLPLGRLFDMDVWQPGGVPLGRTELGLPPRKCLICGGDAKACARSRSHTVEQLQAKTADLLTQALQEAERETVARLAIQALLYEVVTTPKPGLVDCDNSGSHRDMDIFTFMASTAALAPYFAQCCRLGQQTADCAPPETLAALRTPGRLAEGAMLAATHGVNTHKGAVFSLGLLCAALGRSGPGAWHSPKAALRLCADMAAGLTAADFDGLTPETARTAGQKLYLEAGITGIRGQAEAGFPAVLNAGLPVLSAGLAQGRSLNEAGGAALLALICAQTDTNLIARSDRATQQGVQRQIAAVLAAEPYPSADTLRALDAAFIRKNLSPGGSADLLALCYFLHFLQQEEAI